MHFQKLFSDVFVKDSVGNIDHDFIGVSVDSRRVTRGEIYVCISGTKEDGHRFISDAARRGAYAAVVERMPCDPPIPCIEVESTRKAYACLMNNLHDRPTDKLHFYAVTGTNGKTSVSHLLRAIFCKAGMKTALIGTVGGAMTTPDPDVFYPLICKLAQSGVEHIVMEASSHALALGKLAPIKFDAGIFTNLSRDHGDFHRTEQDYFKAKASLFDQCKTGIFNIDDRYGRLLYDRKPCSDSYGCSSAEPPVPEADFSARATVRTEYGIRYELVMKNKIFRVQTAMPWRFAIENTLLAASCASACGIPHRFVRDGIASVPFIPGRLERISPKSGKGENMQIYVDYAHTPDALKNAIAACKSIMRDGQRLIVLFGCGGDRDKEKRPMMGRIASIDADYVIITSDNSRNEDPLDIIDQIKQGVTDQSVVTVIPDRREAIKHALSLLKIGDILLLAGKGHENYIIDKDGYRYFSEREIVSEFYADIDA